MKLSAFLLVILICAVQAASATANWPGTKPLKFEVIAAAGGLIDFVPRELSNDLSASIGVPVVVENRPGAGGNIAAGIVAKAEPDGHMLLVTSTNQVVNPTLLPNPGFDYARDLVPVSMVVAAKMLLVAAPAFPAKDITDVITIAKQKTKSVSIAIAAIGTPLHLAAEMLAQYDNIDLTFVPYDSITQAMPDVMANRVDLAVGAMSTLLPQVRRGALKALAVISPQRSPLAPEIPTSAEAGFAGPADRQLDVHHDHRRHAGARDRTLGYGNRQSSWRFPRSAMPSPSRALTSTTWVRSSLANFSTRKPRATAACLSTRE